MPTTNDEGQRTAEGAGLDYVSDEDGPCVRRRRRGRGWEYTGADGSRITDPDERARIDAIAIPPAWTDVWICPSPDGHILATGRDSKGRKQYRYHPDFRAARDETKFEHLGQFGHLLPDIRRTISTHLSERGLGREKVLALVVTLLDQTLIRIGNDTSAGEGSFGLTTLRDEHVDVEGATIDFEFDAKGGAEHQDSLHDARLARLVKACDDLGGDELFAYRDAEGNVVDVGSSDVNEYLRALTGEDITAKYFRTWGGSTEAVRALAELGWDDDESERERRILDAVDAAAERLDNTRAVARASYVHPVVPESYHEGRLTEAWKRARSRGDLDRAERTLLRLLDEG
jgi:DNA topoisomerase-1